MSVTGRGVAERRDGPNMDPCAAVELSCTGFLAVFREAQR